VTPHSVFLRTGCTLPDGIGLIQEPFCDKWAMVEDMAASSLDRKIRGAGWHFFWLQASSSRLGFGRTAKTAIHRALTVALKQVGGRFNAAELGSLHVATYPGFRVAKDHASYPPHSARHCAGFCQQNRSLARSNAMSPVCLWTRAGHREIPICPHP
jgi:hypothetical protein